MPGGVAESKSTEVHVLHLPLDSTLISFLRYKPIWAFNEVLNQAHLSLLQLREIRNQFFHLHFLTIRAIEEERSVLVGEITILETKLSEENLSEEKAKELNKNLAELRERHQTLPQQKQSILIQHNLEEERYFLFDRMQTYIEARFGKDYHVLLKRLPTPRLANEIFNAEDFETVTRRFNFIFQDRRFDFSFRGVNFPAIILRELIDLGRCTLTDAERTLHIMRLREPERSHALREVPGLESFEPDTLDKLRGKEKFDSSVIARFSWFREEEELDSSITTLFEVIFLRTRLCTKEEWAALHPSTNNLIHDRISYVVRALGNHYITLSQIDKLCRIDAQVAKIYLEYAEQEYKAGNRTHLKIENETSIISFLLKELEKTNYTDINLFDAIGRLALKSPVDRMAIHFSDFLPHLLRYIYSSERGSTNRIVGINVLIAMVRGYPPNQEILYNFIKENLGKDDFDSRHCYRTKEILEAIVYRNPDMQMKIGEFCSTHFIPDFGTHFSEENISLLCSLIDHNSKNLKDHILIVPILMKRIEVILQKDQERLDDLDRIIVLLWTFASQDQATKETLMKIRLSECPEMMDALVFLLQLCKRTSAGIFSIEKVNLSAAGLLTILASNPENVVVMKNKGVFETVKQWKGSTVAKDAAAFKLLRQDTEEYARLAPKFFQATSVAVDAAAIITVKPNPA